MTSDTNVRNIKTSAQSMLTTLKPEEELLFHTRASQENTNKGKDPPIRYISFLQYSGKGRRMSYVYTQGPASRRLQVLKSLEAETE